METVNGSPFTGMYVTWIAVPKPYIRSELARSKFHQGMHQIRNALPHKQE